MLRRALRLSPRVFRAATQVATPASRGFTTAHASTPSKWPKRLLIAASVVGGAVYLLQETPESKEQRRLLALGDECVQQGDFKQATKYFTASFNAVEDVLSPRTTVELAQMYAGLCEALNEYEAALPFYHTALKSVKAVNPISLRGVVGVKIMDGMATCYHKTGRLDTAEKAFKRAISMYEKYHAEFSASSSHKRVAVQLDAIIGNVYLHYALLLASMQRDNEVSLLRLRLAELVRSRPFMRSQETNALDQFDDLVALQALRDERRRERGEEGYGM